jgi:hypothetical protein
MSETEGTTTEEFPGEDVPTPDAPPTEVPEGVDPETGEVLVDDDPDADEAQALAETERRSELAAEKQQQEQEQAATEAAIEQQGKAMDRATKAYTDKLKAALGDDLSGWQPCPMCADGWPGIRMPVMPAPPTLAAIKVAIGEDPDPPLEDDTYSRPCTACGGHGRVGTGSHVTGHKSVICLDCGGTGYIKIGPEREADMPTPTNGAPVVAVPQPLEGDPPRTPEEERLRQLGAIVVWPPKPPDMTKLGIG